MASEENAYISKQKVAVRYGVSSRTIDIWLHDPAKQFPKPYRWGDGIRPRPKWRVADLELWDAKNKEPEGKPN